MSAADFDPVFQSAGQQNGVDPQILKAIAAQESNFNPNAVNKETGATGIMQYIPASAKAYGFDPKDPVASINTAAKMFSQNMQRFGGNVEQAVAAHFGGPDQKQWGPKTTQYVSDVAGKYAAIKQSGGYAPAPQGAAPAQPDPVDAMLAQQAQGQPGAAQQPQQGDADPLDAMLAARASGQPIPAPAAGGPGAAPAQTAAGQPNQPGMLTSFGAGLGHGFGNTVLGAQQLIGHGAQAIGLNNVGGWLTNDAEQGLKNLDTQFSPYEQAHSIAAGAGNIGGQIAGTAPTMLIGPEYAGLSLAGKLGLGAAQGAAGAAMMPVTNAKQAPTLSNLITGEGQQGNDFWSEKLKQVGLGALTGGIAAPVTSAVGNVISGIGGAAQQRLAQAGVNMTPGQILGGGWARTEEKLTSVPILGDLIKNAQQRSVQSFNRATYNEVLSPLGQKYAGPVGNEGVQAVQQTIGDAYDNALSRMTFRATDPHFQSDIANLAGLAQNLPAAQQQTFMNVLRTQVLGKLGPQGLMDGQTLKGAQSELSRIARGYNSDPSFDNRQLGAAIGEIKNAIDNSLPRYNAPDAVQGLANANAAYANFVRLRGAAKGAMNNGGVFTAAQLNSAVRGADKSVGKGASATGNALMQDFSGAGQQVLGSKYPDSGTPGRSMLGLAAGAMAGHAFLPPGVMAPASIGIGAAALPYTTYGQKLAQALLMSRPAGAQAIGQAVNRYVAPLAPALGTALLNR